MEEELGEEEALSVSWGYDEISETGIQIVTDYTEKIKIRPYQNWSCTMGNRKSSIRLSMEKAISAVIMRSILSTVNLDITN